MIYLVLILAYLLHIANCDSKFIVDNLNSEVTDLQANAIKNIGNLIGFNDNSSAISYINKTDELPYAAFFTDSGNL